MIVKNILHLGVKELRSLRCDPIMLVLIVYVFTLSVYSKATTIPETLNNAPIAILDEDRSPLSSRINDAFFPPFFMLPVPITQAEMDAGMDAGLYTFSLDIPPDFQRDVLAGRQPRIQLSVDATRMAQALNGTGYVQSIIDGEVHAFAQRCQMGFTQPADLALRVRFNPNLTRSWFGAVMEVMNGVTMLAIVLTGAALIREREHGTIEHLLVMPVTPSEIMTSKAGAMALVVLVASALSMILVVEGLLSVPIEGSLVLFLTGTALHLFAATSLGIFLGTIARSMPQFGLLMMLVLLTFQMLSGATTPRESMPELVQKLMLLAPDTHFVMLAQAILYRGAGIQAVWPQFVALAGIGTVLFSVSLWRFRKALGSMA